jgi:hypothetical protein
MLDNISKDGDGNKPPGLVRQECCLFCCNKSTSLIFLFNRQALLQLCFPSCLKILLSFSYTKKKPTHITLVL